MSEVGENEPVKSGIDRKGTDLLIGQAVRSWPFSAGRDRQKPAINSHSNVSTEPGAVQVR